MTQNIITAHLYSEKQQLLQNNYKTTELTFKMEKKRLNIDQQPLPPKASKQAV